MPSERAEDVWVDEMDGPERLERAKKRRAEQMKRWERRENTAGPDVKRKRKNEKSLKFQPNVVMLEAAARNDLDEVTRLLENGVSPDLANEDGLTALHQSCIDGCDDMVKYLVEHDANVNACDKELWTPLHAAAACGHMSIIRYLLDNGGDILALNLDGNFPVDVVEDNEEVVKFLDKELSKLGYVEEAIEELRQNQGKQLLDDLKDSLEKGRSLDIQDEVGATAFHVAAANGWTSIVDFLLENEADFEIRDNDGWQPIHAAAAWGHDTTLELLVASGADLDSRTNDSRTPLDLTEEDEIIELIEELRTKQVKYPRKGKGVRRKRSNTSNSSIKRSSIHEKNELSHADTKAERVALFTQLQNSEDSEANSPDDSITSPRTLDAHFGERTSNSSREEANSSGYVSEGSTDLKSEEKLETSDTTKVSKLDDEAKTKRASGDRGVEDKENIKKTTDGTEKEEKSSIPPGNKAATIIKQAPVPKPPRLATTSSSKLEPNTYINLEIEPTESSNSVTVVKESKNDAKELGNAESKNVKPVCADGEQNKSELKKSENAKVGGETTSHKQTRASLPRLISTDKRKAPEPPDSLKTANTKPDSAKVSEKKPATESNKDQANEVPKAPTKRAAPSSSPSAGHRNTAATKNQPEPKDSDAPLANKTAGRGFSFPRSRKTCCLVM